MTGPKPRALLREPLVVALVLTNIGLGALLIHRNYGTPSRPEGLPPGHPDVSVPGGRPLLAPDEPPAGGPAAPMGEGMGMGARGDVRMAPEFEAVERAARGEAAPAASGGALALTGTVKLSPSLKDPWPDGAPVFVIARAAGGGPPFAAKRYDGAKPPFAYALGPGDVMFAGAPTPKKLVVTVRVDQDGDAMTRQLGDLEGGPSKAVGPKGSADVTVDRPAKLVP